MRSVHDHCGNLGPNIIIYPLYYEEIICMQSVKKFYGTDAKMLI